MTESIQDTDNPHIFDPKFEDLHMNTLCGFHSLGPDGLYLHINDTELSWLGYEREEIVGKRTFADLLTAESVEMFNKNFSLFKRQGWIANLEFDMVRKDGAILPVILSATAAYDSEGKYQFSRSMLFNLTDRKRLETELREARRDLEARVDARTAELATANEALLREIDERERVQVELAASQQLLSSIIATAMDGIITVDETHHVVLFNAAAERIFGIMVSEAIGQPLTRFIPKPIHELYQAQHNPSELTGKRNGSRRTATLSEPVLGVRKFGEEFPLDASVSQMEVGGELLYTVILRDVSERKILEEQFLRAQRMESIGTLAGGIAHDLNNVLAPILMSVGLLQKRLDDPTSLRLLEVLRANAERGAGMIKQVLSFARGVQGEWLTLQPRYLVQEVVQILKETFPRNITIQSTVKDDVRSVTGDATQLHQVLMNLCINARDAMPAGGILRLGIENARIDETYAGMNPDARAGLYVRITVADTGHGIAPEHMSRIFEPFFSTKEEGRGTGLGLSTALGILRAHEGFLLVKSDPGAGAEFQIHLPAIESEAVSPDEAPISALPRGQGELVLVVDDEAAIREISRRVLEAFGYRVLVANDGTEAVAHYAKQGDEIAVVITDIMMPFLDGPNTIRALRRMNPHVRVIASSGLPGSQTDGELTSLGVTTFLVKPYTAGAILEALAKVLRA